MSRHAPPRLAVAPERGIRPGVGIEHRELALGRKQRLVVVRPVQVDQVVAEPLQQAQRHRRIVDELPVAARPITRRTISCSSSQRSSPPSSSTAFDRRRVAQREHRLDRAAVRAAADQPLVGALAEHQLQRADDHRLAGPGFAGHADQPGPSSHSSSSTSARFRIFRSVSIGFAATPALCQPPPRNQ